MTCPHADPNCSRLYRDTVCLWCEIDAHEARFLWWVGFGLLVALTVASWAWVELVRWEPFR